MNGSNQGPLKFRKRAGVWRNSTGNCVYDPRVKTATSYRWWVFCREFNGKVIFNNHSYSVSTNRHQGVVRSLLRELKVRVHLTIGTEASLSDPEACLRELYGRVFDAEFRASRARIRKSQSDWKACAREYQREATAFEKTAGVKLSKRELKALRKETERAAMERIEWDRKHRAERRDADKLRKREAEDILNNSYVNQTEVSNAQE